MDKHLHHNPLELGNGELHIGNSVLPVLTANIFLSIKKTGDDQRVCLRFEKPIDVNKIKQKGDPFIQFVLKKSFYVEGRLIPIKKIPLFTLSGLQEGQQQIDFLVSPRVELFDPILHPKGD